MKRRTFLKSSLVMGAGFSSTVKNLAFASDGDVYMPSAGETPAAHEAVVQKQPHIVLIMTDQQRGDALGCMGNNIVKTPHIDKLAGEGTLFVNGYTSSPSSTPARAGLLTGMAPWEHGLLGYGRVATRYKYEMPRMLRELGYYTFGIGKMHWFPQKCLHGFHATLVDESGRSETPDFISDYREWFQLNAPGQNPDLTGIGWNDHQSGVYKLEERLHPTAWTGQTACELIRNYTNDQPLFLKVSFARPHSPYDPPRRFLEMYKDADIPAPAIGDWCDQYSKLTDPQQGASDAPFGNFGEAYAKEARRHYFANITFIDQQVGKIIRALKAKGMYDNALICFTADHGDMLGDHYHWRKTYPYQGSVSIPYVVKWPQYMSTTLPPGSKVDAPVELRDFLPTFIDLGGGTIPEDMSGRSLATLVRERPSSWRQFVDMEHATCYSPDNYWCALTDGKIKYIWNFHNGKEQLFDLMQDPYEQKECSKVSRYKEQLDAMRQAMIRHLTPRGEGFVKDGKLVVRETTLLYGPNYPKDKK